MVPRNSAPSWKEQARELLHQAILDAARSTFAERGYASATVDEIAARAGVGKGTIYNHVEGGKAGLFVAVLGEHFDDLHAIARQRLAEAEGPLRDRYAAFVAAIARYFQEHGDLLLVHLREVPQLLLADEGGEQAARLREQRDRLVETLVPPMERAVERGEIRPVPVQMTAHVAFGALLGYLFQTSAHASCAAGANAAPVEGLEPEEAARYLTALLFDGITGDGPLCRAPASPGPGRPRG